MGAEVSAFVQFSVYETKINYKLMEFLREERDIWGVQKVQRLTINFSHGSHMYFEPYKACHVFNEKLKRVA